MLLLYRGVSTVHKKGKIFLHITNVCEDKQVIKSNERIKW
jgi:hypothetical protein